MINHQEHEANVSAYIFALMNKWEILTVFFLAEQNIYSELITWSIRNMSKVIHVFYDKKARLQYRLADELKTLSIIYKSL